MRRFMILMLAATVVMSMWLLSSCNFERKFQAPLLEGMGENGFDITTEAFYAQKFFNQGLTLAYGLNPAEAERSFREAIAQDEDCAMCYWGLAYVLGHKYNKGMDEVANKEAYDAAQKAMQLSENVTEREKYLIKAIAARYSPDFEKRQELDQAYADAMKIAYETFPEDDDIAAIYSESLMDHFCGIRTNN